MKRVRPSPPKFRPCCAVSVLFFTVVSSPLAVDLLEGMLLLDPERRLTAKQGLSHPYLAEYHDLESEPDSDPYDDSFESLELAVGEWKSECDTEPKGPSGRTESTSVWYTAICWPASILACDCSPLTEESIRGPFAG